MKPEPITVPPQERSRYEFIYRILLDSPLVPVMPDDALRRVARELDAALALPLETGVGTGSISNQQEWCRWLRSFLEQFRPADGKMSLTEMINITSQALSCLPPPLRPLDVNECGCVDTCPVHAPKGGGGGTP